MTIKKTYLKSRPVCKVTFRLPAEQAKMANEVKLVGDFNQWNENVSPMRKLKSGEFTQTIELPKGGEFAFRYLIDNNEWQNDWEADKYQPNNLTFDENSIVSI